MTAGGSAALRAAVARVLRARGSVANATPVQDRKDTEPVARRWTATASPVRYNPDQAGDCPSPVTTTRGVESTCTGGGSSFPSLAFNSWNRRALTRTRDSSDAIALL